MKVFNSIVELQNTLFEAKKQGKSIGLVPTMGALHSGHASLVKLAREENDVVVVSVFVNPTQFNDKKDLKTYPRTLKEDCALLETLGVDCVLAPSAEEIYPTKDERHFEFPPTTTVMEGAHRPGHFNGVCQVVSRLFYIVRPERAYFGEKDWQQIAVIKAMVKFLSLDVEIRECPIIRSESGLALSSRNALLSQEEKITATKIYQTLKQSQAMVKINTLEETRAFVINTLNTTDGLEVEYFSIVDGNTLRELSSWDDSTYVVGCITVYCGEKPVRLIDHIKYITPKNQ